MNPFYAPVASRAGHRCEYCRAPEVIFNLAFEVEHIQPVSRGGTDDLKNLALSCRACNLFKADRNVAMDEATHAEVRLFDPRQDDWDDHFLWNPETGEIEGKTPGGRVTVATLKMNRPVQKSARQVWKTLGIYP